MLKTGPINMLKQYSLYRKPSEDKAIRYHCVLIITQRTTQLFQIQNTEIYIFFHALTQTESSLLALGFMSVCLVRFSGDFFHFEYIATHLQPREQFSCLMLSDNPYEAN